jgi:hypothetical protein
MNARQQARQQETPHCIVSTRPTISAATKAHPDRADAADDDDHEGQDQHRFAHADLDRLDRTDKRAGKPARAAPSAKTTV